MAYTASMMGEELTRRRRALRLSQVALAGELGVHPMTVSRWERGARTMDVAWSTVVTQRLGALERDKQRRERRARRDQPDA